MNHLTIGVYLTRDGGTRIVLCTNAPGEYPVVCCDKHGAIMSTRTVDGRMFAGVDNPLDLVTRIGDYP